MMNTLPTTGASDADINSHITAEIVNRIESRFFFPAEKLEFMFMFMLTSTCACEHKSLFQHQ
jgi:hypothetical protein